MSCRYYGGGGCSPEPLGDDAEAFDRSCSPRARSLAIRCMAAKKDLGKAAPFRLALRLLQAVDAKVEPGQELDTEDSQTDQGQKRMVQI